MSCCKIMGLFIVKYIIPRVASQKRVGFPILSVRRWSDNTAYLVLIVHEVYLKTGRKMSQIHQIKKNQEQYQP